MAIRTTPSAVRAIIETKSSIDVAPFIDVASELVDYVKAQDANGDLTAGLLRQIETYLAAHFYALKDQQYKEKKTGDASAAFQVGQSGKGCFEMNDWGRTAMSLDVSGCLKQLNEGRRKAKLSWLGLPPSEQTDYEDRD